MTNKSIVFRAATLVGAFSITTLLAVGPIGIGTSQAVAANNGNGNGNGGSSQGSNGNGNSNNNGNAGSNSKSKISDIASADNTAVGDKGHTGKNADNKLKSNSGKLASKLGALNAAHASANAFAHASPNSRIGKIKAYYTANAAAQIADAQVDSDLLAIQTYNDAVNQLATDQLNLPVGDPILTTDQDAIDAALDAYTAATAALQADQATAAGADAATQDALNAAANKQPVSPETKVALDALLVGKI